MGELLFNPEKHSTILKETATLPEFRESIEDEETKDLTILDFFRISDEVTESSKKFLDWFEPRFGNLRTKEDFERVSSSIMEAIGILQEKPYLLSPREGHPFGISKKVLKDLGIKDKGKLTPEEEKTNSKDLFKGIPDLLGFFRKVAVNMSEESGQKAALSPNRKIKAEAEKTSVCRILSIAYVIELIKNNQDFKNFFRTARSLLGIEKEEGLFKMNSTFHLFPREEITILEDPKEDFNLLEWLQKDQTLINCSLAINGIIYNIPEIRIGLKGGLRALLKMLREPRAEKLGVLNDFLRMRLILGDDTETEKIVELLSDIEKGFEQADNKRIITKISAKNYFTEEELKEFFPEIITKDTNDFDDEEEDSEEYLGEKTTYRRGLLEKIKLDKNPNSGEGYRNIAVNVELHDSKKETSRRKTPLFSFEIQIMRTTEFIRNESLESASTHFVLDAKQFLMFISRINSKLKKEEIIDAIRQYIEKEVNTEKIPKALHGKEYSDISGLKAKQEQADGARLVTEKRFVKFSGTLEEKANILFDFLAREGILKTTTINFPEKEKPKDKQKRVRSYYIHNKQLEKILNLIGVEKTDKIVV